METLQSDDPSELGTYRLLRRLGAGGMGRVYLARSPGGRTVAVKVVRPDLAADSDFRARFRHEVEIAKAVSGRFTAPVVDADPDASLPWLATSYVLGPDLTDVVAAHGALPERTVRALAAGLAAALQDIHAAGLMHRDLKPSNVLLAADGPRLIDFGIARAVDGSRMTQTGVVVGSPGYMSPEQAVGKDVGVAGDVFALGSVLAFAAAGRGAFGDGTASHAALLYQVVHGEADLTDVPPSLLGLVRACLMKDPAQRPAPGEIVTALAGQGIDAALHDWLPSAVASTIATHAAGILDLEAPGTPQTAPQPPNHPATGFGPAPTMLDGASSTGTADHGTTPGGTSVPAYGTPLPGTVQVGQAAEPAPARSRRRVLGMALGGAAAVAVAGGIAWALTSDDASDDAKGAPGTGTSADPAVDDFTTPPAGVAPQPLWHKSVGKDSTSPRVPLLIHDGLLLVSGDPLVAYDVRTGEARWTKAGICRPGAQLLFHDGNVFLADGDYEGVLVAYDVKTGEEAWRSRLGKQLSVDDTIAIDDKNVYVTATDYGQSKSATEYRAAVAAVSHTTGKKTWIQHRDWGTKDYDVQGTASGKYLVYADSNLNLTVRDTATGGQLWTRKIADEWSWQPTVANGLVFLPGDELEAVDVEKGEAAWTLDPAGRRGFGTPTVVGGVLYVSDHDDGVWAVNVKTGKRNWLCDELDVDGPESFRRVGSTLYGATGAVDGGIVALETRTGKLRWTYTDSKAVGEPWQVVPAGNRLLATHGHEIYALPAV
ncbi:PQQ-binding-like beta-propeller repeat protein [Streptomyces olivaceus]|uniref:protein kinase domain-containing protein n=1 Tax=Streptomyces olivaceus TaxID=47716 RepID=UPI001CC9DDF5|nr:PQQ-binding-like beta-propeller repeat protein [Streptomyces olivaceus]MBZ6289875.1 PQQ-binding-like beta-propeller repeat protein [Streptomyces olivaceus]MBZ6328263.1 PQQ-binding-like beta-propeller repeat protein [Streptomyces olivaceus]